MLYGITSSLVLALAFLDAAVAIPHGALVPSLAVREDPPAAQTGATKSPDVVVADGFRLKPRSEYEANEANDATHVDVADGFRLMTRGSDEAQNAAHVDVADGFRVKARGQDKAVDDAHVDVADGFKA